MKSSGKKSKNIQDARGPTGAYGRPSGLTASRGYSDWGKQIKKDNANLSKTPSKMAVDSGFKGIEKAARPLTAEGIKKSVAKRKK